MQQQKNPQKKKKNHHIPHAASVFKRIRTTLKRALKMAMHLVIPIPTLIHHRQLEQSPHVGTIARERDEHRDVHRIVLGVLPVGVKVNRPVITAHRERVAHYVFTHAHPFGQRVTLHRETVRSVHRLADEAGRRAIVGGGLGIRHGFA